MMKKKTNRKSLEFEKINELPNEALSSSNSKDNFLVKSRSM